MLFVLLAPLPVGAQTLQDYQDAVSKYGTKCTCENIPNQSLRNDCNTAGNARDRLCKEDKWSCQWAKLETAALKENIKRMDQQLSKLNEEKDQLDGRKSVASGDAKANIEKEIEQKKAAIDKLSPERKFSDESLATNRNDAENRIKWGEDCYNARTDVDKIFDRAASAAQSVSDPAIKPYANQLLSTWQKCKGEHVQALQDVTNEINYCKDCLQGRK
jgi:hypothetical protein